MAWVGVYYGNTTSLTLDQGNVSMLKAAVLPLLPGRVGPGAARSRNSSVHEARLMIMPPDSSGSSSIGISTGIRSNGNDSCG